MSTLRFGRGAVCALAFPTIVLAQGGAKSPALIASGPLASSMPTASAHASTIVETPTGLVAAWFGGTREGAPDVGIWLTRNITGMWTAPVEVADGVQPDGSRFPCYNPVLFQPRGGPLMLYYKVGPQPAKWWGMVKTSTNNGASWSIATRLPDRVLGPIKNKPVQLANGTIVSGSSTESVDADPVWRVHFELSHDGGVSWTSVRPGVFPGGTPIHAIQPALLLFADGRIQALGRTRSDRVFETWSLDGGTSWSAISLTTLPNPNSGIDAVMLRDGRGLLVYNNTTRGRTPLSIALSRDGATWTDALTLVSDAGEYSYPAVIQSRDGLVHVTYTWNRKRIEHAVVDPSKLLPK